MIYRRILLLISILVVVDLFMACCDCPELIETTYTNCDISVGNLDNAGIRIVQAEEDSVLRTAYGIRLQFIRNEEICMRSGGGFFLQPAMAFSCGCEYGRLTPLDTIVDLRITTVGDFDPDHPPGSDVTSAFQRLRGDVVTPIHLLIMEMGDESISDLDSDIANGADLILFDPPPQTGIFSFSIQVDLSDGRTLSDTTTEVILF